MSATKLKQATVEVTREVFRRMPALLTRAAFLEVTGLGKDELAGLVASGGVSVWKPPSPAKGRAGCYGKYRKVDAARIAGIEGWLQ